MNAPNAIPRLFWLICPHLLRKFNCSRESLVALFDRLPTQVRSETVLLYRDKLSSPEAVYEELRWLSENLNNSKRHLMTYGRPEWVSELDLAGLHCPDGVPLAPLRKVLGPEPLLGCSRHDATFRGDEQKQGANYVFVSPVHAPVSKAQEHPKLTADQLQKISSSSEVPVIGLGGVTPDNAAAVLSAGATGLAFLGAPLMLGEPSQVLINFAAKL